MTRNQLEARWEQVKGRAKATWGRLTDQDLDIIAGRHDDLVGILQERYGLMRHELERQVSRFEAAH